MEELRDLDAEGLLAASAGAVRVRRLAEVCDLEVLAQWAAVHSVDPTQGPDPDRARWARRFGDVLVHPGGEGTPGVQDYSLGEIALARGTGVTATYNALADVLDLQHRLPMTWAICCAGEAEVWVARRAAKLSRHLPAECVGVVDAAVARIIAREGAGRVISVAEAKVIEAAPALHEQRLAEERARRYVGFSCTDEAGLRTVIARVQAGDAAWIEATVERVAEILIPQHPGAKVAEVRAIAFGWLARPAELLALLLEHTETPDETEGFRDATAPTESTEPPGTEESQDPVSQGPADEPEPADAPCELIRALAFPADLLEALRGADFSRWAPRCTFYVHLHEAALGSARGVARVEGIGPVALSQLQALLGRAHLVIKPVIDLSDRVRSTAYEHPESLKERVHLTTGGDYWPYATSVSREVDYDHPSPYRDPDEGGPPGQTGTHNSGPLGRRHHRWKTHAGYRARQCGQGRYVWISPHGLAFLVDHRGTRMIDPKHAQMIYEAPPGVDLYPINLRVEIDLPRPD